MSKEKLVYLEGFLENFEDQSFDTMSMSVDSYKQVKEIFEEDTNFDKNILDRILAQCTKDLKPDVPHLPIVLATVTAILKKIDERMYIRALVPSAQEIINVLNVIASLSKITSLKTTCLETLLAYPDHVLVMIADTEHHGLLQIIDNYCSSIIPPECRNLTFRLFIRLFKILSPNTKRKLIHDGLDIWFQKVIPTAVLLLPMNPFNSEDIMEALELLTDSLVLLNYSTNKEWLTLFECIYNPDKYPATLKALLENHNNMWHRLWIILIRLLKDHITKVVHNKQKGSPINSLLPIVEAAFKMDVDSRIQAFKCWEVLIENFSSEQNDSIISRRMKLLVIPLKAQNAKVEQSAIAKIDAWWHLIRAYHSHIDTLTTLALMPFISCCFGHPDRKFEVPGMLSNDLKSKCIEMLVEIFGHVECSGCVGVHKLKSKIISPALLKSNWPEWLHALMIAIRFAAVQDSEKVTQQLSCLWKSLLLTLAELPEGEDRNNMFSNILGDIFIFMECNTESEKLIDKFYRVMIVPIFNKRNNASKLLQSRFFDDNKSLTKILKFLLDPGKDILKTKSPEDLRPITDILLDQTICKPKMIIPWLNINLPTSESSAILWCAVADSIRQADVELNDSLLICLLAWPVHHIAALSSERTENFYSYWKRLFNSCHIQNAPEFEKLIPYIPTMPTNTVSAVNLKFCVLLVLLDLYILRKNFSHSGFDASFTALNKLLNSMKVYKDIATIFPILLDTFFKVNNALSLNVNVALAQKYLPLYHPLIKLTMQDEAPTLDIKWRLLKPLNEMFKIPEYSKLQHIMTDDLVSYLTIETQITGNHKVLDDILNIFPTKTKFGPEKNTTVKAGIDKEENGKTTVTMKQIAEKPTVSEVNNIVEPKSNIPAKVIKLPTGNNTSPSHKIIITPKPVKTTALNEKHASKTVPLKLVETRAASEKDHLMIKPALAGTKDSRSDPVKPQIIADNILRDTSVTITRLVGTKKPIEEKDTTLPKDTPTQMIEHVTIIRNESPSSKSTESNKRVKKKEPTIVNTVFENGEEYAVVKSHWKFNPKKLTENQKEKFKRKREDIPALYQDLSQSQDEVKLNKWKTDSQDTTTTTSKSNSNSASDKDINAILKKIPSTNVIPKIMENVLSDKNKVEKIEENNLHDMSLKSSESITPKTPRATLKDRVYKNMRNLIEKSGLRDNSRISTDVIVDENLRTPPSKKQNIEKVTNSAPSKIGSDRPSRLIKKPRKYEDPEFISPKKRRQSTSDSKPDIPLEINDARPADKLASQNIQAAKLNNFESISNGDPRPSIGDADTLKNNKIVPETESPNIVADLAPNDDNNVPNSTKKVKANKAVSTPILETPDKKVDAVFIKNKKGSSVSRIQKQLLIDTVEGHPLLKTPGRQRNKKGMSGPERESITFVPDETTTPTQKKKRGRPPKAKPILDMKNQSPNTASFTVLDSQDSQEKLPTSVVLSQDMPSAPSREKSSSSLSSQDLASSEDIIESSQDSSITTISSKSSKTLKLYPIPVVRLDFSNPLKKDKTTQDSSHTQDLINQFDEGIALSGSIIEKSNEDIELPKNKSVAQDKTEDLTENMDTETFDDKQTLGSSDCIIISDSNTPIAINTQQSVGNETQEIAEADTEPFETQNITRAQIHGDFLCLSNQLEICDDKNNERLGNNTPDDITQTLCDEIPNNGEEAVSSPFKDDTQKNKEFLNDTLEISPIKTLSPVRDHKSPSPETSSDYVVIQLASPVHSNGEPFDEKCDSPEIFTEDKTSPEKRDQSPPRDEVKVTNNSPSSSLSLKKNRAKVGRGSGRAAQIMGLCAPDKLNAIIDAGKGICEEPKKGSPIITPAKRNLKMSNMKNLPDHPPRDAANEVNVTEDDNDETFPKLKRLLPTSDCSPSGPILKRKLADIVDDTSISPASKRKRVSFHDPPVSTTVAVKKYIEPYSLSSPQNSASKRLERQARGFACTKSQKRLDQMFKLEMTKAVDSFSNDAPLSANDSEMSSIEQTPAAEVVKTSDLNNTDPICPDLMDCKDPIDNIAGELSSPAMKDLLVKEWAGKVDTVADLAKMTELEVNRLCIKAPKVKVAKQVLTDYAAMRNFTLNETKFPSPAAKSNQSSGAPNQVSMEVQTDVTPTIDCEMQTIKPTVTCTFSQTYIRRHSDAVVQTDDSTTQSTGDLIAACFSNVKDRPDFIEQLGNQLRDTDLQRVAGKLSFEASLDLLMNKTDSSNRDAVISRLIQDKGKEVSSNTISQLTDYICKRFQSNDLTLLCIELLKKQLDGNGEKRT